MISKEEIAISFRYLDGDLFWNNPKRGVNTKRKISATNTGGYRYAMLNGKNYLCHRIIWVMFNGDIPDGYFVEHKDRNKLNNRIDNLRLATANENCYNIGKRSHNTTGFKGVSYSKQHKKYQAKITFNGIQKHLGVFNTAKQAYSMYLMAATLLQGEFANFE